MGAPSFKELLASDISSVFLNPVEFAETLNIDGRELTVMLDDNELLERDKVGAHMDGTYKSRRLIYVEKLLFGPRPAQGKNLVLDGRQYRVAACTEEAGILAIELEALRS